MSGAWALYRVIFWPVLLPSLLLSVGIGAIAPVIVVAALRTGASEAFASVIIAITAVVALVVAVPVGAFIDAVGDGKAVALATAVTGATAGVTVIALVWPSRWSLILFVGSAIVRTPAMVTWNLARQAALADAVDPTLRGRAMTALGGCMRLGNLAGPLIGAAVLLVLPLWSVFVFCLIMAALATAVLFARRLNAGFEDARRRRREQSAQGPVQGVNWRAVGFAGVSIIVLAVSRVAQPILVALWGLRIGWSEAYISFVVAFGAAIELVFMMPSGYFKDRLGRTVVLVLCLAPYGAGFFVVALFPHSLGLILAVVVMSVGNGFGAGINMTIGADLSPEVGRSKFLSIWAMFSHAGALGGPLIISGMLWLWSLPAATFLVGAAALGGALWSAAVAPVTHLPSPTAARSREGVG